MNDSALPAAEKTYDLFLSYKSETANEVRGVAEALMASGLKVWFAEYEIPSQLFEDDQGIQATIDAGVAASRHALIFSNDKWAWAPYCCQEMQRICDLLCLGSEFERIAEVRIPSHPPQYEPHVRWPQLLDPRVRSMTYTGKTEDVVAFINSLGWFSRPIPRPVDPVALARPSRISLGYGLGLDVGTFVEHPAPELLHSDLHRSDRFAGEVHLFHGSIQGRKARLMVCVNPFRTVLGNMSVSARGNANDRKTYNAYRKMSDGWLRGEDQQGIGLHLHFWDGRSHLGLSSRMSGGDEDVSRWERRYSVTLKRIVPCLRCGQRDLVPYVRQDLTRRAWIPTLCTNPKCQARRDVPLESLTPEMLQICSDCRGEGVIVDEDAIRRQQGDTEWRFVCLSPDHNGQICGAQMIVPTGCVGEVGEVDISLVLDLPSQDADARREFGRLVPFADHIANSLTHERARSVWTWGRSCMLLAKVYVLCIVAATFDYVSVRYESTTANCWLAALLGLVIMDLFCGLTMVEPENEAVSTGMRWGWWLRVIPLPTYGRPLDRFWNTLVGSVLSLLLVTVCGMLTIGWLAIAFGYYRAETSLWFWGLAGALTNAMGRAAINLIPESNTASQQPRAEGSLATGGQPA